MQVQYGYLQQYNMYDVYAYIKHVCDVHSLELFYLCCFIVHFRSCFLSRSLLMHIICRCENVWGGRRQGTCYSSGALPIKHFTAVVCYLELFCTKTGHKLQNDWLFRLFIRYALESRFRLSRVPTHPTEITGVVCALVYHIV